MKNIFKDWNLFEKIWLFLFSTIILSVGFIFNDSFISIVASLTGVLCVVLVAKGKIANYYFGVINVLCYAYISYTVQLFGEVMLNILFYLPIQFIGLYLWKKNMNTNEIGTPTVKAKKLTKIGWLYTVILVFFVGLIYGIFLESIGSSQAELDAFAVTLSITAQILMLKRYAEQWLLWILVNVLTIVLWLNVFMHTGNSITLLVMWMAYLVNSIYGYIKWKKLAEKEVSQ